MIHGCAILCNPIYLGNMENSLYLVLRVNLFSSKEKVVSSLDFLPYVTGKECIVQACFSQLEGG